MSNLPYCTNQTILNSKPLPKPFVTKDNYAAVQCGKGLMVIFNNQQLKYCTTTKIAMTYVNKHRKGKSLGELPI